MKRLVPALVATTAVAAPVVAPAAAPASQQQTIARTAQASGDFDTLVMLVGKAGLTGALSARTKLTVFAPTDAAFAKLPKSTLDALGKDKAKLRRVLLYHVAPGVVTARQVVKLRSARTLEGSRVRFRVRHGNVFVNRAKVVKADVRASNGVIHAIDRVLIPSR